MARKRAYLGQERGNSFENLLLGGRVRGSTWAGQNKDHPARHQERADNSEARRDLHGAYCFGDHCVERQEGHAENGKGARFEACVMAAPDDGRQEGDAEDDGEDVGPPRLGWVDDKVERECEVEIAVRVACIGQDIGDHGVEQNQEQHEIPELGPCRDSAKVAPVEHVMFDRAKHYAKWPCMRFDAWNWSFAG